MQRQILLMVSLLLFSKFLSGQSSCDSNAVFAIAEEPPIPNITYSQIEATLNNEIAKDHLIMPEKNLIEIRFIINCKGESFNYKMISPIDPELFKNITLTLRKINWTPAKQAQRNVDIWKTLTISLKKGKFKLQGEKEFKNKNKSKNQDR